MKKSLVFAAIVTCIQSGATLKTNSDSAKSIFQENKCNKCHSIESQSIKRTSEPPEGAKYPPPDLSGVGLKHTSDWMAQWVTKQVEMHDKKHMYKFKGSDDELKTLTTWLGTLKKKPA